MDPADVPGPRRRRGEAAFGYTIPNLLIDHAMRNPHVPPGFWRGVNINQNAIYLECFMDELAQAAGQDPLEFRRKLMANHPKHLAVLNAVAERIGWGKPAPQGVFRGLAQHMGFGSYVAGCGGSLGHDGNKLKVHRIVGATDPRLRRQSGADRTAGRRLVRLRPVGAVLSASAPSRTARIEQTNFDTYNSMRIAEMPKVESIVMPSRRLLGRRRRADHLRRGAGGAQRLLRGDRQAHPLVPAEEPQHRDELRPDSLQAAAGGLAAAACDCATSQRRRTGRRFLLKSQSLASRVAAAPYAAVLPGIAVLNYSPN